MILLPPERFDHPCHVTESYFPLQDMPKVCGGIPDAQACVYLKQPGGPWIMLPKVGPGGVAQRTQDLLREHECGHVHGWSAKHEDAR